MAQGSNRTKIGRNRAKCAAYRASGRREANKARRVARRANTTSSLTRLLREETAKREREMRNLERYAEMARSGRLHISVDPARCF